MEGPIDMAQKGRESIIYDYDLDLWVNMVGGWVYGIFTGVTSDLGVPSTHLVTSIIKCGMILLIHIQTLTV